MRRVTPTPRVVAHRGASDDEAEHTLAAYQRALADGADGLECDVRLTRDGVLVCVHDRRVDRTSSGRGVLSTLELADLEELDFGSWRSPGAPGRNLVDDGEEVDRDRTRVLTLERLLATVSDSARSVELAIETKHPTRYAGLVELALIELLARFGLTRPAAGRRPSVRVMSFSALSLRRIHGLAPAVPTVLLLKRLPLRYRDGVLPQRIRIAGPSLRVLRAHPGFVARVHATGGEVHVWTVDEVADVQYVVGLAVDVVITNRPRATLAVLGR